MIKKKLTLRLPCKGLPSFMVHSSSLRYNHIPKSPLPDPLILIQKLLLFNQLIAVLDF